MQYLAADGEQSVKICQIIYNSLNFTTIWIVLMHFLNSPFWIWTLNQPSFSWKWNENLHMTVMIKNPDLAKSISFSFCIFLFSISFCSIFHLSNAKSVKRIEKFMIDSLISTLFILSNETIEKSINIQWKYHFHWSCLIFLFLNFEVNYFHWSLEQKQKWLERTEKTQKERRELTKLKKESKKQHKTNSQWNRNRQIFEAFREVKPRIIEVKIISVHYRLHICIYTS